MTRFKLAGIALVAFLGAARLAAGQGTIYVPSTAPFSEPAIAAREEVDECQLPKTQIDLLIAAAKDARVDLVVDDEAVKANQGRVLLLEIAAVSNGGHPIQGHQKVLAVKARLFRNGAQIADDYAVRNSTGGFFGDFMSSCAVLRRCQRALARDLLRWLQYPVPGWHTGE